MVAIADKFGKASISNDYAVATTVKTTRVSGVTVLEAFDLSKFAPDTPVFFITYKKTTDPVTNVVSVTNQVSWKAIVNTGANTLTNLTLAPGFADLGNDVGDFIECIPTSFWETSLIDGLLASLAPDGTLAESAMGKIYPIGCIYTEITGVNPATTFGFGTWVAFGEGRVLVGKSTAGTFSTPGGTGGEENHTLINTELPNTIVSTAGTGIAAYGSTMSSGFGMSGTKGGGGGHNNLQPYIVVYFWNRTA